MSGDIFIAVCTLGNVRAEWAVGLSTMNCSMGRSQQLSLIKDLPTDDARNFAVALASALECEYLMFWDDDMIPRLTDAPKRLITAMDQNPEIDVISGVYPIRRAVPEPCVVEKQGHGSYWGWRDGQVHPVYMGGTGYMLIRMSRLNETVPEPYTCRSTVLGQYFKTERDDVGIITDDFWFAAYCEHWKLRQYVHGGVICDQIQKDGEMVRLDEAVAEVVA